MLIFLKFLFMHIIKLRTLIYFGIIFTVLNWFGKLSKKKKSRKVFFFKSVPQYRCKTPHRILKSSVYVYQHVRAYTYMYIQPTAWEQSLKLQSLEVPRCCWWWSKFTNMALQSTHKNLLLMAQGKHSFGHNSTKNSGKFSWPFSASLSCCLPKSD